MKKEVKILAAIVAVVVIAGVIGASLYRNTGTTVPNSESANLPAPGPMTSTETAPAPAVDPEKLIREDSPALGPEDAKVTIVEFLDPECESCAMFHPIVKSVLKENDGKVRYVLRYMPLHPNSYTAADFLEAAGEQGKYWEALDYLFQKQPEWGTRHGHGAGAAQPDVKALFKKYAADLGLDAAKMEAGYAANKYMPKTDRDKKDGESIGIRQTPTLFVNGVKLSRLDETSLRSMVAGEMAK